MYGRPVNEDIFQWIISAVLTNLSIPNTRILQSYNSLILHVLRGMTNWSLAKPIVNLFLFKYSEHHKSRIIHNELTQILFKAWELPTGRTVVYNEL